MSTYYMKQKIGFNDKYIIYDAKQEEVFIIEGDKRTVSLDRFFGNIFSLGHKLRINDLKGNTLFIVKRKPGFIWKDYEIIDFNKNKSALIRQKRNIFLPKMSIEIEGDNYLINGDIMARNFTISKDKSLMVQVSKKILSLGDIYEIMTYNNENDALILAIVVAIDNCYHN